MAELVSWVSDRLYEIVGLSDRQVAEYITELSKRSMSFEELKGKLESTGAITMSASVEAFAAELWNKFPREKHAAITVPVKKTKNVRYKLLLDDDTPEVSGRTVTSPIHRHRSKKTYRSQKTASWESDEEDAHIPTTGEDSDSDEWERLDTCSYLGFQKMCIYRY